MFSIFHFDFSINTGMIYVKTKCPYIYIYFFTKFLLSKIIKKLKVSRTNKGFSICFTYFSNYFYMTIQTKKNILYGLKLSNQQIWLLSIGYPIHYTRMYMSFVKVICIVNNIFCIFSF